MRTLGAERAADKRADQEPACKPNPLQEPRWSEPVPNLGCPVRPVRWRFSDSYPNGTHACGRMSLRHSPELAINPLLIRAFFSLDSYYYSEPKCQRCAVNC